MVEWESNIPCNYCGSNNQSFYDYIERKKMQLVQCNECMLVWQDPRRKFDPKTDPKRNMEEAMKAFRIKYNRPWAKLYHKHVILRALELKHSAKTLFDVGYGAGTTLIEGRALGLECSGNEINIASVKKMREYGFEVYDSKTIDLLLEKKFDIILCLDNIEHTETPMEDLEWMYAHHNDGGVLYLTTLYLGCPIHQRDGDNWNLFGTSHNYYYYPDVLKRMIEAAGYEIISEGKSNAIITLTARKN